MHDSSTHLDILQKRWKIFLSSFEREKKGEMKTFHHWRAGKFSYKWKSDELKSLLFMATLNGIKNIERSQLLRNLSKIFMLIKKTFTLKFFFNKIHLLKLFTIIFHNLSKFPSCFFFHLMSLFFLQNNIFLRMSGRDEQNKIGEKLKILNWQWQD